MVTASLTSFFVVRERVCDFVRLSYKTWAIIIIRKERVNSVTRKLKRESSKSAQKTANVKQNKRGGSLCRFDQLYNLRCK